MSHTSELFDPDAPLTEGEQAIDVGSDDKKFRVIVVPANSWAPLHDKMLSHRDDQERLIELKELVGGYVEVVTTDALLALSRHLDLPSGNMVCMLVDEDGRYNLRKLNPRACVFYGGEIVGDVIFTIRRHRADGSYDLEPLPDQVTIDAITKWVLDNSSRS